ncbi:MAG: hypothetical protein RJB62_161 [Pseudomonadota bacterium]|jgi:uncharacterized protein YcnI
MLRNLATGTALVISLATPAFAHIVFAEPQTASDSYYAGFLQVGHGCGTSPTTTIRVEIPDGINVARPQPKPGWTLEVEKTTLATPVPSEGGTITERVSAITWHGGLPADQFDLFGIMMRLPATVGPIYFPTVQTCAEGENRWVDIPAAGAAWGSVPHPAPILTLHETATPVVPATGGDTEHHH